MRKVHPAPKQSAHQTFFIMEISFSGKRAIITGAGQGIGRAVSKRLAEAGAKVFAISRTKKYLDTLKEEVPSIEIISLDVADWGETRRVLESIDEPIDLLVNNAAILIAGPFDDIKEDSLDKMFSVNVKATVNISQVVTKGMKARGTGGSIVNVSSVVSSKGVPDHAGYGITKGGLDQLTRVMAVELGPYNIRVNTVNPTVVNTEMAKIEWEDEAKATAMKSTIPLRRFAEPEEVVDAIVYLLSDRASMINGTSLFVDGGNMAA